MKNNDTPMANHVVNLQNNIENSINQALRLGVNPGVIMLMLETEKLELFMKTREAESSKIQPANQLPPELPPNGIPFRPDGGR